MCKIALTVMLIFIVNTSNGQDDYKFQRDHMVKTQLMARDITDPVTLKEKVMAFIHRNHGFHILINNKAKIKLAIC